MDRNTVVLLVASFVTVVFTDPVCAMQHPADIPAWVKDAIFYQIFPERFANGDTSNDPPGAEHWGGEPKSNNFFGGDLKGILDHLDYISSLGVNAIYLNPIFESTSNHKYNTKDYLEIDPHFGDNKTFKALVDGAHARGIRIILDGVFNHTGVDFFAFHDIKVHGAKSRYLGWYNVYGLPLGPPNKPNYESWWGHGSLPKLMTTNPEVQQYLFQVTRHWMEFGIDGWRLDVPNEIPHGFWIEWRKLVKSINPDAYIVGEIWGNATPWLKGDQFDGVMNYRFREACLDFFVRKKLLVTAFDSTLAKERAQYPEAVNYALQNLVGSHDTERILTMCKGDSEIEKMVLLFQMTYIGAPMIYYGDEIGMQGGRDPGCRGTMIWDQSKQDTSLLSTYRAAVRMRNDNTVLKHGTFETVLTDDSNFVYVFRRSVEDRHAIIAINNGRSIRRVSVRLLGGEEAFIWKQVWPTGGRQLKPEAHTFQISLPALSVCVYIGGKG